MSYQIRDDGFLYDHTGRKLPRSEAAQIINQLRKTQGDPHQVYLMSDVRKQYLKPGRTNDLPERMKQHERNLGCQCDLLYWVTLPNIDKASQLESAILEFLRGLGRVPRLGKEYFEWRTSDAWLIQQLMMTVPLVSLPQTFATLASTYPAYIQMYRTSADYVNEEVKYLFGDAVHHHLIEEFAGVVIEPPIDDDDTEEANPVVGGFLRARGVAHRADIQQ